MTVLCNGIFNFFLLLGYVTADIRTGVDMVTKLSNNLIPAVLGDLAKTQQNIVIGPFGLANNLGMLLEASQGKTRQELLTFLKVFPEDMADIKRGFKAYCDLFLEHSSHTEAAGSFNRASLTSGVKLNSSYRSTLAKHYCANITDNTEEVENGVFSLGSDSGVMSHWKDYEKLAVYTFLSHQSLLPFTKRDGTQVQVPMIPQVGVFRSIRWGSTQAVLLPLETKLVHLLVVIPDTYEDLTVSINRLSNDTLSQLVPTMPREELEVFLPQMTVINKAVDLGSVLQGRNVRLVFDARKADLSRGVDKDTTAHVKELHQDAYFSTSFVAVNSVAGVSTSAGSHRVKRDARKVYVDKPFLFFVLHRDTQLVLLAGKVESPVQVPI